MEHNDIDNQLCYKFILITKPIIYLLRQFKSILISLCCENYIPSKLKIESQKIAYTMKTSFSFKKIYIYTSELETKIYYIKYICIKLSIRTINFNYLLELIMQIL